NIPILYFAFEDSAPRFMSRQGAIHGSYDLLTLRNPLMPPNFLPNHERCMDEVSKLPIYVEDMPTTVDKLCRKIEWYKRKHGIEGVVIDGLKDIILTEGENQTNKEGAVNAALVTASKLNDVAILTISHLTKIEEDGWISRRNIRGTDTQNSSARMVLVFQDAGIPSQIRQDYGAYGDEIVLDCQKSSYSHRSITALDMDLTRGMFTEKERQQGVTL
ncbi:hypothetical protein OAF54_03730, partial [bacterium]|nr:hypothetical protein [bacterium]